MKNNGICYRTDDDMVYVEQQAFYIVTETFRLGMNGWRKKCVYLLLTFLLMTIVINLSLTLWMIKVLEFSLDGIGLLKIMNQGLKLKGNSYIVDNLTANSIKSRTGEPLSIKSNKDFMMRSRNANGILSNYMHLESDQFRVLAGKFKIVDHRKKVLFSVGTNGVYIGTELLKVPGEVIVDGSILTTLVTSERGEKLRLETSTRKLEVLGANCVNVDSRAGKLEAEAYDDFRCESRDGRVHLIADSIYVPHIPTARASIFPVSASVSTIHQICVCENGKLFTAPSHEECHMSNDEVIC
ncbi:zeta-sarcoglycan-like [Cylas formicarius]|uniref:zeta-sarcoglycan-like n=1 Tax=Cylas formicarius TaxID=197179 RepID=UPI0029588ADD|nr:zeta-sarcoglycan-like [Cylas formicarius]